ncbi:MAG: hypothetical protein ACKV19_17390 [Verrucomicrobiales bacterium]
MKLRYYLQAAAALVVVWSAVAVVSAAMNASIPTAKKLLEYLEENPMQQLPRPEVIDRVAADYVRLPFLEKRSLRAPETNGRFDAFLSSLTPEEKGRFVELALPGGFRDLLDGFGKMDQRDRQRNLERSRRELLENLGDSPARAMIEAAGPALLKQIAENGLGPFFDGLPPDVKLQLLPMIEQMQNNARQLRD